MATEAEDITCIKDEEVLRRMWQGTEDFARKKEIRARMYKLREQRLKEFYTTGEVLSDVQSVTPEVSDGTEKSEIAQIVTKHSDPTGMTLTDSIEDQGFMALKSKEIRDSESPTRDFQIAQSSGDGNAQSYWKVESSSDSYQAVGSGGQYEVSSQSQRRSMAGENDKVISDMSTSAGSRSIVDRNGETRILTEGSESFGDSSGRNLVSHNTLNNGDVMMRTSEGSSSRAVSVSGSRMVSSHQSTVQSQQSQKWSSSTSSSSSSKVTSSSYTTDGMVEDYADKKVGDVWEEKGPDGVTRTVRVVEKVEGKGDQGGVTRITRIVKTTGSAGDFTDGDSKAVRTTTITKTMRGHGDQWDDNTKSSTNVVETNMPSNEDYWIEEGSGGREGTRRVITKIIRTTGVRGDGNYVVEDGSGGTVVTEKLVRTIGRSADDVQRVKEESSRVHKQEESRTQTVDRKTSSSRDVEDKSVIHDRKMIDNESADASTKLIRNEQITSRVSSEEEKRRKTVEMERKGFVIQSGQTVTETTTSDRQITGRQEKESEITDDTRQYVTKRVQEEKGINKSESQTRRESVKIEKEGMKHESEPREEPQKPGSERKPSRDRPNAEQPKQNDSVKTPQREERTPDERPVDREYREPERTTDKPEKVPQHGDITHTIQVTRDTDERIDIQTKRPGDTTKDTRGRKPEDDDNVNSKRPKSPEDDKAPRKDRPRDGVSETKTVQDTEKKTGRYTTTYQWSFTPQKINVEVSASHAAFASSLRAPSLSPDRPTSPYRSSSEITYTCGRRSPTKSTSRSSLDRTTPTPRKSYTPEPNKANKTSKSPTTMDQDGKPRTKSGEPRNLSPSRKATPVTIDGRPIGKSPKDVKTQPKDKKKSPGSRKRSGTPGVSPTTSPERDTDKPGRTRTTSSSSESSRLTYNRDVRITKEEKYRGVTDFIEMEKDREPKTAPRAPGVDRLREKSPEYSSDGSLVQELYPKKTNRQPSPLAGPKEKGFKPIRPEDDSKPRRPQSSSSSPSTSPERKLLPGKKGVPAQKSVGKTPSRDTINKSSPKKSPGDTQKSGPERVTPDGRRVEPRSSLTPDDKDRRGVLKPQDVKSQKEKDTKKPMSKPGEKRPNETEPTTGSKRIPSDKPGSKKPNECVTPDGRKVQKKLGVHTDEDEPECEEYPVDGTEEPSRKPGKRPDDDDSEPLQEYATPDGRRVPKKTGKKPEDEPEDYYTTPDGRRLPKKPGTRPTDDEPEDYYTTPDGKRVPKKPGKKPEDEPENYYTTPDGRRVPRKKGTSPGDDEPEDHYVTPDGRRVTRKPGKKPEDEPEDYYVTPDGRRVPKKPGAKPGDQEPEDYYTTPDGRRVPRKKGTKTGDDEPEDRYVTPDGRRVPKKPGTKPGDHEPEDYYTTPDGRRVPRKPGTKISDDEPQDYYTSPDGRRMPKKPGTKTGEQPEDYYATPDGKRVPRKPGTKPGDDEPEDHYVTPDVRTVPIKPGTRPGDEPENYGETPDGRKVPRKPGTRPGEEEPEDYYTTPDGRMPKKTDKKPEDEPDDYYITPDGRRIPRKPGTRAGDEPEDGGVTPDGRKIPREPGMKTGDEPEDYEISPDGRKVPKKPGIRPRKDEPEDHYITPDGRRAPKQPGSKPGDDEPTDYYTTPDGRRIPKKPGTKPGDDKPGDYYITPDGSRVTRKPETKDGDEPEDYHLTPDGKKISKKPGTRPEDDKPEDSYVTPDGRRLSKTPANRPEDESDNYHLTPDGRRVPRKPGDDEPKDQYVTPDGRRVPRKPGTRPGDDETEDYYTTPDGRRVPKKPSTKPEDDEPEDYYTTADGRRMPRKPGTRPGHEPEDDSVTPDGRKVPKKPGTKHGDDEPDDYYTTPESRKVPRKPGTKPEEGDSDDYYITPEGRRVPRQPGDDEPDDYYTTPDGRRIPRKPDSKPEDEPEDYYTTPDGRRVPRKPGTKPGDYEPEGQYITPDGRRVPKKPGKKPEDEPDDYYITPDGRRVPRKPGTKPSDDEPQDYYTTPVDKRVQKKPDIKPGDDEPEKFYTTPDGRRVPRKPGTSPGDDEPEDHYVTPDGRRVPRKPGKKPEDEPEDYYVTPDGRKVPRKPGTKPGDDEPEDHYVTPDGRRVPQKPGTRRGDEPENYRVTPDGRRVPRRPGTKPTEDEPEDYHATPDGRRVPKKPGTKPGDHEPEDYYTTPDGERIPREPGTKPSDDEPQDYHTTPDGRRVPKKPGAKPGDDEPEDYYTTPDGRRVPRKKGTSPGDDEPEDHYVTPDGRRVTRKPGKKPEDESEDYYVTPDGRKVPRKPGTKPGDDEPEDDYVTPDGRRVPKKPGAKPGDQEPEDYYTTPDGRRVPRKKGTRPGDDEPEDHYVTPDGRRVPRKPGTRRGDEPEDYRVTPDGRKVPRKPGTRPGEEEPDDYYTTPDGRRLPKKPSKKPEDVLEDYYITPDGKRMPRKPGTRAGDDEPKDYYVTPDGRRVQRKPGMKPENEWDDYRVTPDGRRVLKKKPSNEEDDEEPLQEYVTPDGRRVLRKKPKGDEPDDSDEYPEGNERRPYYDDGEEPEDEYDRAPGRRDRTKPVGEPEEYYTSPDGRRVPVTPTKSGRTPQHEYVTPDGRRVTGKKPTTEPDSRVPGDYINGVTGKKPTRPGDKEPKYPGSVTDRSPSSRPTSRALEPTKTTGRRAPDHDYVTPDGRPVTGKRPVGKTAPTTPDKKPLTTRAGTTPKATPTAPGTRSTTLPGTRKPEPSYSSPTKASLVKRPIDTGKTPVGRPRTSPHDEPTRRAPAVPSKPYDTKRRPGMEPDFDDEEPGRRGTTTTTSRVTDFIHAERRAETRQQRVTSRSFEYDEDQPSDLVDEDDELLPEDKTRKQPKTTRATSGPILKPKADPKTPTRKPLPQQKSEPKMRTTYGTMPKAKTPATPLKKEPLDGKNKPIGRTQPISKQPSKQQPSTRDIKKPRRTTSESSEPEDEVEYTEMRYSEVDRQYTQTERKRKVRTKDSPQVGRPKDSKGVVEYPQSPLDASPESRPNFTMVNEKRMEELRPRYPDSVTEPEDESEEEYEPRRLKGKPDTLTEEDEEQPRRGKTKKTPEQDEPTDDGDEETMSVAQRVNKFIETARQAGSSPLPSRPEDITLKGLDDTINSYIENNELDDDIDNVNAVRKAKTMFENIAYSQVNTTAKRELLRQDDILSRPSVFDARKRPETEPSDDDTQKQVPEVPQQKKPMEPEQLRRENLLKLGIRRAEDILNNDIFDKTDTFPRRKTPSPERPVGKYDTFPTRKSPLKGDHEGTSPRRTSPERAPSPEKARRPEEPKTGTPSETKPVTSRYPFSKPKAEDVKPTTQKPLKSNSVMSRYPFADKPRDSDRQKVNEYPSPDDRHGKQPSSRIPEDSDLKTPRLLKEPSPTGRRNEPYDDDRDSRRPSDGTPGGRRDSPRRADEPSDRSGYPDGKRGYPGDKPGRPGSPRKGYPERSPTRSDRHDKSPSPGVRDRPDERSPTGRRPSGKTYPDDKTPSGRRPSGMDYPGDRSPADRRPSTKGYPEDSSPTGRRPSAKDYPDDRSPTGRRPGEKTGYPDGRTPLGRQPSGKDQQDDRSPFGRRPSGKDYPDDASPTGKRPSGKDYPDDRSPTGKRPGVKDYPDDRSPTGRRPSGKEYPEDKSPTGRRPSRDYPGDRSPGKQTPPDRSPVGSRRSPGRRYPEDISPTGRRPSERDYRGDTSPDRRTSPDRSPVDTRRSPGKQYPEDSYPGGRRPSGKDYPLDGSRRSPSPTSRRPGSPRKDYPDSRGSPVDGYPKDRRPSGKTYPEDERPGYKSPTSTKPDRRGYPTERTSDSYRKPSRDNLFDGRDKPREGSPRTDEVKISKFGVCLRKTTTGSSIMKKLFADVGKKESELDRIFDLEVLETMLEKAKGYDERRLIRQQIRIVKKMIENNELPEQPRRKSTQDDYDSDIPSRGRDSPFRKPEDRREPIYRSPKSPEKSIFDRKSPEKTQPGRFEPIDGTRRRPDDRLYSTTTNIRRTSTERTTDLFTSSVDYTSKRPTLRQPSKTDIIDKSPEITSPQIVNKAVKKSLLDDETREESLTDSITSGYGIGPTDEKGMPLFGLKALRRQNKTTPDVEPDFTPYQEEPSPRDIKDSSGRPMFGLKALQVSRSPTRNGEEKPASEPRDKSPLKDLVNRHDKYARGNAVSQPQQHTPSRLRDTFVQNRNEEFIRKESEAEDVNRLIKDRGQSLRAMIQRHESLTESDRKRPETVTTSSSFSSSTVVRSSAIRKPDGSISVKGRVIQGETISKDGEKPKSRIRTAEYTYDTPEEGVGTVSEEEQEMIDGRVSSRRTSSREITSRSNTTESILSRTSRKSLSPERKSPDHWPREDGRSKPSRRPISDKLSHLSRKFSNEPEDTGRKPLGQEPRSEPHYSSHTRSSRLHSNIHNSSTTQSDRSVTSRYNPEDDTLTGRRRSTTPQDDGSAINRRRSSTPLDELKESLFRKSSATHDESDTSSTLFTRYTRGGAVKALSQKFQQGAEAETPKNTASYPKAGLILRSASFKHTNGDLSPQESPAYKSSVSMEPRVGSPTRSTTPGLGYDSKYSETNERNWSRDGETEYDGYSETRVTSRTVTESEGKSFLGNHTKVSGMDDIISRMKAADNEDLGFDTPEDIHARTLLNKFLGASVMMSGMEPLVKASGNASATLVSQVERQRILQSSPTEGLGGKSYVTTDSHRDYDNIDNIWDEKRLRQLLDACTDYEGRRKIRARLRTVMAEKSACEDVVAAAQEEERSGDGSASVQAGESLLPYLVEQLRTSLILESRPGPSQKNEEGLAVTHMEDSGTESGEDLRLLAGLRDSICEGTDVKKTEQLNKKLLTEVQEALQKLQVSLSSGAENSLDPVTKETLLQLVTRLQSSLKLAPGIAQSSELRSPNRNRFANRRLNRQSRHTVGVTREELADARRMIQESSLTGGGESGGNFRDTGQSGFLPKKPENANQTGSEQPLVSYAVVKQNSADDVTSNASSGPFKLFRPGHFNPGKLKIPTQPSFAVGKTFLSSQQIQSADEWVRNQIGNTRRLSEGCSAPNSNYSTPACLSPSSNHAPAPEANVTASGPSILTSVQTSEQQRNENLHKSPSPPYKNIQYAPAVFSPTQPEAQPKSKPENSNKPHNTGVFSQGLAHSKSVSDNSKGFRPRSPVKHSLSVDNGDSILEYDPSLMLFTPEQSVKIAVHKAAINKQLSQEGEKRMRKMSIESDIGSTDDEIMEEDGDISSVTDDEDESTVKPGKGNKGNYPVPQLPNQNGDYPNSGMGGYKAHDHIPNHYPDARNKPLPGINRYNSVEGLEEKKNFTRTVSEESKKGQPAGETVNRFEKRIQEIQNERKAENRQNVRSIEELQKIYTDRKEKYMERKNNVDSRSQMIQNVQAKYQKSLSDQGPNQKTYNPQRLNPDIRSKYENEIRKNMENDLRSKPVWSEDEGEKRRKESIKGLEYLMALQHNGVELPQNPMDISQTESEISISSTSTENSISHAQRLLQLATGEKPGKYYNKSSKKVKMKRANTIDIPKPLNYYDVDDDYSDYTDDEQKREACTSTVKSMKPTVPTLEPKTESDKKFLALLRQQNQPKISNTIWMKDQEPQKRNLFSENQWGNRFSRIKTAFESGDGKKEDSARHVQVSNAVTGARAFWKSADDSAAILKSHKDSLSVADRPKLTKQGSMFLKQLFQQKELDEKPGRLPWTNQKENIVHGSLTVYPQKPEMSRINKANVNQFSHAPMSAFRPVERKTDPAKIYNAVPAKIAKPVPIMPEKQDVPQTLPWLKEMSDRTLNSTVAKFESMSSREASPTLMVSPRAKIQDRITFGFQNQEVSPPVRPINRSPSQSNFVQSRTQAFTPNYPNVKIKPEPDIPVNIPKLERYQYPGEVVAPKKEFFNPVTTYSVDVAATSTVYPVIQPERTDGFEFLNDSAVSTPEEQMAITKVMGSNVQQQAVTVRQKTHRRNDEDDNRTSAAKNLTSMLQRFSSPPTERSPEPIRPRGSVPDVTYPKSSLLPPNLPTGKSSPTSPGNRSLSPLYDEKLRAMKPGEVQLRRPSSAESLAMSNSSEELRESGEPITSRLQIPIGPGQYRTSSLLDLSPQGSPTHPIPGSSSLRKSESCHQLTGQKPKRPQSLILPDLPTPQRKTPTSLTKTKSSHALSFPKQFEAVINPSAVEMKQKTVEEYFQVKKRTKKDVKTEMVELDDNLENVDEAFDALFSSVTTNNVSAKKSDGFRQRNNINQISKSISTSAIQRPRNTSSRSLTTTTKSTDSGYSKITSEKSGFSSVSSSKAATNKPISPFAKFQQLDRQNSGSSSTPSSPGAGKAPLFTFTDPKLSRSASGVKDRLLQWCQMKTKNYKNIQIENFSTSWSNGLAFCALIHHFRPEAFDYDSLSPKERRKNFELAFKVAEEEAGIAPLLDVEDMVMMRKPDWKCVFTYVQSIYCRFRNED